MFLLQVFSALIKKIVVFVTTFTFYVCLFYFAAFLEKW